jgi:hypothetical protein
MSEKTGRHGNKKSGNQRRPVFGTGDEHVVRLFVLAIIHRRARFGRSGVMFSHSIVSPDIASKTDVNRSMEPSLETLGMPGAIGMPAAFPLIEALHNVGENAMLDNAAAEPPRCRGDQLARGVARRPLAARRAVGRIVSGVTPMSGERWNIMRRS